jgi:hypothetical protein
MLAVSTVGIIILVALAAFALLFAGGYTAAWRRSRALAESLQGRIASADKALADARAEDRGWERATMEAAARTAAGPRDVTALHLIQVVDKPGTDADQAVFRAEHPDGDATTVILGRRDGDWYAI